MSVRRLGNQLRRLVAALGVARCDCGAILPRELLQPRPVKILEEILLPGDLEAIAELATSEEADELQAILNHCLEVHPDAEARDWRFRFAESFDTRPRCPSCGAAVDHGQGIRFISVGRPAPEDLLDTLRSEPLFAARFAELETVLQHRAACVPESTP
jgi:hypothetical protein